MSQAISQGEADYAAFLDRDVETVADADVPPDIIIECKSLSDLLNDGASSQLRRDAEAPSWTRKGVEVCTYRAEWWIYNLCRRGVSQPSW